MKDTPKTPRETVLAEALHLIAEDGVEAVSFDVFDTMLLRRCTDPDGAFERAFQLAPVASRSPGQAEAFVQHRRIAERSARKAASATRGSPEVGIAEIYARFPCRLFGVDRPEPLIAAEFRAEEELCHATPDILRLFDAARERGLRVGFLSDTYWSGEQIAALLRVGLPGRNWDFLYASSDRGVGKRNGLFDLYLRQQKLSATAVRHIGDNPASDVHSPRRLGIRALHTPQCDAALAAILSREDAMFRSACAATAPAMRLDRGERTLRRQVAADLDMPDAAFAYGARVIGPVLKTFIDFAAARAAEIEIIPGRKTAVAFIARDGFLPHAIWTACGHPAAAYVEINRRTALLSAADDDTALETFFRNIKRLDLAGARNFLKRDTPRLRKYFARAENGIVDGAGFVADLPHLLSRGELATLAREGRRRLLAHLRREIPDFDACTDLVLVDLGYSGTVQKALRRVFALAGLPHRLHGVYLIPIDEDIAAIDEPDTATGLISGTVLLPAPRHALLSNITVLEQIGCAPRGSVGDYTEDGEAIREADPRSPEQTALCARIRDGAIAYAARAARMRPESPPPDATAAAWATAGLGRALLLPTDDELELLAPLRHDVNLGTQGVADMADARTAQDLLAALPLPAALTPRFPPMWMAGSLAHVSPAHGALYAVAALGHLPEASLADAAVAEVAVVVTEARSNRGFPVKVAAMRGAFGELRIRVPLPQSLDTGLVAFPAAILPPRGTIRGLFLSIGDDARQAAATAIPCRLPSDALSGVGIRLSSDGAYVTESSDGFLAVRPPPLAGKVGILALAVAPADGMRLLAAETAYLSDK